MTITPSVSQMRMLAAIRRHEWAIREDAVRHFALEALEASGKEDSWLEQFYEMRPAMRVDGDGVAHIAIRGALMHSGAPIYEKIGLMTRYKTIIEEMAAAKRLGARAILFAVDSPGGTVMGSTESAEAILDCPLPTMAYCDGLACSAAYKLASGTGMIVASPTAEVGNIGSILSWMDCSKFWAENGIEFKALVSEGADLKSTFHTEPNEVQIQFLQERIDEMGKAFRDHVQKGRKSAGAKLDPEVWRAGWYSGERAGDLGLIDEIGTIEEARQELLASLKRK